ncbi:MAG: AsmA-like C-terminal region-containing protein [Pelagibacteraceae bacterium]
MKKILFRLILLVVLILIATLTYLSTVGIETKSFNSQIKEKINKLDPNLELELKTVKLIINPLTFDVDVKTVGPNLFYRSKKLEIETVKTKVLLKSILQNKFAIDNLEISTKSVQLKNLISFVRVIKNTPELLILETIVKNGHIVADINLEFDENGKIKNNYFITGFLKDGNLSLLKKISADKINFLFEIKDQQVKFNEIDLVLNNKKLSSNSIEIDNSRNEIEIKGDFSNKDIGFNENDLSLFSDLLTNQNIFEKINFASTNNFIFNLDGKFKIKNLKITSKVDLKELSIKNNFELKNFLPGLDKNILFKNHLINIDYEKDKFNISGKGSALFQKEESKIDYTFEQNKELINLKTNLEIGKNPIKLSFINYDKEKNLDSNLKLEIISKDEKQFLIKELNFTENDNKFLVKNILLNKEFKIKDIDSVNLNYKDTEKKINQLELIKNDDSYILKGKSFNANSLIENLLDDKKQKKNELFNPNLNLDIDIKKVFIDDEFLLNNLSGKIIFKKNNLDKANLSAQFLNDEKFTFTVNTNEEETVTTLYSAKAKPLVKRYKFIKGYEGGYLDFYSAKKNNISNSKLKIYDFSLKELPALTKLLTLASLQGIADLLSGEGIGFDEFEMNFQNQDNLMTIDEIYAIGPAISILMDGYVEKNKLVSLRGTLVPATTINKAIGTIPILGKILVGKKTGEGVFGVSFKIKGPPKDLETTVNPIKTLTPRFITRTLEKIKK